MAPGFSPVASEPKLQGVALAALSAAVIDPHDQATLTEVASVASLTAEQFAAAVSVVHAVLPRLPLLAVRAADDLVALAPSVPDSPGDPINSSAALCARAGLCLAQAHALRREGAAAAAAAVRARALFAEAGDRMGLAHCDLVAGEAAIALGHYAETLRLLEASRVAFRELDARHGQAEAALALAHYHAETTRFAGALALAQEAAELAPDDPWLACRSRIQAADAAFNQTHYPEAAAAYRTLLPECQAGGWRLDEAHVRLMQGLLATQQGDFGAAGAHLEAALASYYAEETDYYVAVCHRGLAMLNRRLGRYDEALAYAQAGLRAFQAMGHGVAVGRCQHAIGLINHSWNRYDAAVEAYEAALARYQTADLPHEQIAVRMNLAMILEERGHYHAALDCYERTLADSRNLGLTNVAAFCLENIAMLQGRLGRFVEAVVSYRQARRAFRRLRSPLDAQICAARQAAMLHVLGHQRAARRLLNGAQRYFQEHDRQIPLAFCELTLGEIATGRGQQAQALAHYEAALDPLVRHGQGVDAALCRLLIGEAHLAAGDAEAAHVALAEALGVFAAGFPDLAARTEHGLGRAAKAMHDSAAAAYYWQEAVTHIGIARRGIVTESHAGSFYEGRRHIYEDALDGWVQVGEASRALEVAEASKGQVLGALLQQRDVLNAAFTGQSPEARALWEKSWAIERELEALRSRWPSAEVGGTRSMVALSEAVKRAPADTQSRLARLSAEQSELFERVRRSAASIEVLDPSLPFSVARFSRTIAREHGRNSGALAYHLRADRLVIFWVTPAQVRVWVRPLSRLSMAKLTQAVDPNPEQRELIYADRLRGTTVAEAPGRRLLRSLADLLIPEELRGELGPERPLLIAPHGLLHYLPFQALLLDKDEPLLERALVSYAPTLRVWEAVQERRRTLGNADADGPALVCGLGDFNGRAAPLPFAETEARDLAGQLGNRTTLLLGPSATTERLLEWSDQRILERFEVIHLATHAVFDMDRPLRSRILLADGALSVADLFRCRLNARLVVLSACQTALSALRPGDELLGLREALLFAGANALLVSLWQVDDASTARLMDAFYRHLRGGVAPAAALTAAQRQMRAAFGSAYHWAPFVLIG